MSHSIEKSRPDDSVRGVTEKRSITRVLHFTTNNGLLGVLSSGVLLSRDNLNSDRRLEAIRLLNARDRSRDIDWTGYVSLSISTVNGSFFGTSRRWHSSDGVWWSVLAFDPVIMTHPGVVFATTNNAYPVVQRRTGGDGLEGLFAPEVPWGMYGSVHRRTAAHALEQPTDPQAEVLYPGGVPLTFLTGIYVPEPEHLDEIAGWVSALGSIADVAVACRPELFA